MKHTCKFARLELRLGKWDKKTGLTKEYLLEKKENESGTMNWWLSSSLYLPQQKTWSSSLHPSPQTHMHTFLKRLQSSHQKTKSKDLVPNGKSILLFSNLGKEQCRGNYRVCFFLKSISLGEDSLICIKVLKLVT